MTTKIFNSKLLLFGEYGLMADAMAFSVPFPKFQGRLDFDLDHTHSESTSKIRKLYEHLKIGESFQKLNFPFNIERMEHDLSQGLYFNSNIPQQYGVGSSGALVAALFSRYSVCSASEIKGTPELLKSDFALMESYFHGRSSGIDPLISYLNQPLLLDSQKKIKTLQLDLSQMGLSIALIDTNTVGPTGPLVEHFIERLNSQEFKRTFERQFIPSNDGCINSLLNGNKSEFFLWLEHLILFQLEQFQRMIPP